MYVEEKTDGEPLSVAAHELLAHLIQRARRLIADPTRFKLAPKSHGQYCIETAFISGVPRHHFITHSGARLGPHLCQYRSAALVPELPPAFHPPASAVQRYAIDHTWRCDAGGALQRRSHGTSLATIPFRDRIFARRAPNSNLPRLRRTILFGPPQPPASTTVVSSAQSEIRIGNVSRRSVMFHKLVMPWRRPPLL